MAGHTLHGSLVRQMVQLRVPTRGHCLFPITAGLGPALLFSAGYWP